MKAKRIKTIDAMEAPKWSRLRSDPHFDILTNLTDAPPLPSWLKSGKTIVPMHPVMQDTVVLPACPSSPEVVHRSPVSPAPKPTPIMAFNGDEAAWFKEDDEAWFVKEPETTARPRQGLPGWMAATIGFTVVALTWSTIGWLILRTL